MELGRAQSLAMQYQDLMFEVRVVKRLPFRCVKSLRDIDIVHFGKERLTDAPHFHRDALPALLLQSL